MYYIRIFTSNWPTCEMSLQLGALTYTIKVSSEEKQYTKHTNDMLY